VPVTVYAAREDAHFTRLDQGTLAAANVMF
jgi:hypothetical protein